MDMDELEFRLRMALGDRLKALLEALTKGDIDD